MLGRFAAVVLVIVVVAWIVGGIMRDRAKR
jgi:hypothetical protein